MSDKVPWLNAIGEEIDPRKLGWLPRTDVPAPHGMEIWEHPSGRLHLHNRRANGPFKLAVLRKIKPQDQP